MPPLGGSQRGVAARQCGLAAAHLRRELRVRPLRDHCPGGNCRHRSGSTRHGLSRSGRGVAATLHARHAQAPIRRHSTLQPIAWYPPPEHGAGAGEQSTHLLHAAAGLPGCAVPPPGRQRRCGLGGTPAGLQTIDRCELWVVAVSANAPAGRKEQNFRWRMGGSADAPRPTDRVMLGHCAF